MNDTIENIADVVLNLPLAFSFKFNESCLVSKGLRLSGDKLRILKLGYCTCLCEAPSSRS